MNSHFFMSSFSWEYEVWSCLNNWPDTAKGHDYAHTGFVYWVAEYIELYCQKKHSDWNAKHDWRERLLIDWSCSKKRLIPGEARWSILVTMKPQLCLARVLQRNLIAITILEQYSQIHMIVVKLFMILQFCDGACWHLGIMYNLKLAAGTLGKSLTSYKENHRRRQSDVAYILIDLHTTRENSFVKISTSVFPKIK